MITDEECFMQLRMTKQEVIDEMEKHWQSIQDRLANPINEKEFSEGVRIGFYRNGEIGYAIIKTKEDLINAWTAEGSPYACMRDDFLETLARKGE